MACDISPGTDLESTYSGTLTRVGGEREPALGLTICTGCAEETIHVIVLEAGSGQEETGSIMRVN